MALLLIESGDRLLVRSPGESNQKLTKLVLRVFVFFLLSTWYYGVK